MYSLNNGKKKVKITPHNVDYELNISNPYLKNSIPIEGSLITFNDIYIPNEVFIKALELEKITCSVRVICICDVFMSIYYFDINIVLGLFTFLVSFNGYLSTINYKSSYLACYLWYQYIQLTSRFVYLLYVLAYYLDNNSDYYQENNTLTHENTTLTNENNNISHFTEMKIFAFNNPVLDCILVTSMFIMQIFITYYIHRFFRLLPKEEDYRLITIE